MHGLVSLFLEVIALAIILLVVGLVVPCVLVVALTTIMALIILMRIVRSAIVAITSVALMVVPDTFVEFFLRTICIFWTLLRDDTGPFGQAYVLKTLTH